MFPSKVYNAYCPATVRTLCCLELSLTDHFVVKRSPSFPEFGPSDARGGGMSDSPKAVLTFSGLRSPVLERLACRCFPLLGSDPQVREQRFCDRVETVVFHKLHSGSA